MRLRRGSSGPDKPTRRAARPTRRAARKAAKAGARAAAGAATTAAAATGTHAVRRGRKVVGRTMRLVRFGIVASAIAAAVWWALQRRQDQQSTPLGSAADPFGVPGGDGSDGSGLGARGSASQGRTASGPEDGGGSSTTRSRGVLPAEELVDLSEAAHVLEVDESRIPVMVEGGLLEPVGGSGGSGTSMRFRRADVEAVRLQGG